MLRFYSPVNTMGSCLAWSVYLTTRLLGRLGPLSGLPVLCTFFRQKLTTALLESGKGETDRRKYFMINLHERMLPSSAGVEPATSWSPVGRRIQLSHQGQLLTCMSTHNICIYGELRKKYLRIITEHSPLTLVLLNPDIPCLCKQCRSRSVGF